MRKPRILMIEDETDVLALNRKHLEPQGYEIHCAKTLEEARACLYEYPPDLILLDVLMPDGSGYDFCAEVRKNTTAPILYLTCMGRDEDAVRGLLAGGDDYIAKPYSLDVLSVRVIAALRRSGFVSAGRIEKPPLVIDLLSGRVTLDGVEISLTQKEMQLLGFLACHAGREFSPAEIYAAVWGEGGAASSDAHTVRSYISKLRKKIRAGKGHFDILLTPGKGYLFMRTGFEAEMRMA